MKPIPIFIIINTINIHSKVFLFYIKRNEIVQFLNNHRILSRLLFAGNITKQPGYMNKKCRIIGDLKNTDKLMNDAFWIGVWPGLEKEHLDFVILKFKEFLSKIQ